MFLVILSILSGFFTVINGHGRLIEPPSRASAWRFGFNTPPDYNDHESFCGGFTRQWVKNNGKCGVCGDPWDSNSPRLHEFGGTYGQGVIVRNYKPSSNVPIKVELTASHMGYFEFSLCPDYKTTTQECLNKNILENSKPQGDSNDEKYRFYPKNGNQIYEMTFKLPESFTCRHCLLQWRYIAGNNWGDCPNGTSSIGCGPQEEFRACSDVSILEKSTLPTNVSTLKPFVTITTETTSEIPSETDKPTQDYSYSPLNAILIALVTFLITFLGLFLIYFHFYEVGSQIKTWIDKIFKREDVKSDLKSDLKGDLKVNLQNSCQKNSNNLENNLKTNLENNLETFPIVPPRNKKVKSINDQMTMEEIDLNGVSVI